MSAILKFDFQKKKTITFFWSKLSKLRKKRHNFACDVFPKTRTSSGTIPHLLSVLAGWKKTKQNKTKQNKTKHKTKQNKTKNKTKHLMGVVALPFGRRGLNKMNVQVLSERKKNIIDKNKYDLS